MVISRRRFARWCAKCGECGRVIAQALRVHVWPVLAEGRIKAVVHSVFVAEDVRHATGSGACNAHGLMESHAHVGKIVLMWSAA